MRTSAQQQGRRLRGTRKNLSARQLGRGRLDAFVQKRDHDSSFPGGRADPTARSRTRSFRERPGARAPLTLTPGTVRGSGMSHSPINVY